MRGNLACFCAALCLWSLSTQTTRAAENPQPPAVPGEVRQFDGKRVRIYHDVDLLGTGKPSALHTRYLTMILRQAGATVTRGAAEEEKPADVVIFGEPLGPPPELDPAAAGAADPFLAMKAGRQREEADAYNRARPKLERDAADAGARVLRSGDVAGALGIRVTEPQIVEALDARAREALKRPLPPFDAERVSFGDVVNFVRDVGHADVSVNWRALEAAGVDRDAPVKLRFGAMPLSEALDKLLGRMGGKAAKLGYAVRAGVITISTADDLGAAGR